MEEKLFSVTISHQIGSGGAYIGEKLSERLGIPFLDRAILKEVSNQLNLAESELEHREERLSSFWENFNRLVAYTNPTTSLTSQTYFPTDKDLFQVECDTIKRIAEKSSAIFLGRCGYYVLRDHPRKVSIMLIADQSSRVKRLQELYKISEKEALEMIRTNDRERSEYIRTFTKQNWLDVRLYDICINTTSVGLDCAADLAENCIRAKLRLTEK